HDYGAGIGRAMGMPIVVKDIDAVANTASTGVLAYTDGIAASKEALYASFPDGLKQRTPTRTGCDDVA
ncbi:MAG: hypothetical protein ACSHWY_10830, partial [Octadecabacter sp.]